MLSYGRNILLYAAWFLYLLLSYVTIQANSHIYNLPLGIASLPSLPLVFLFSTLPLSLGLLLFSYLRQFTRNSFSFFLLTAASALSLLGFLCLCQGSLLLYVAGIIIFMIACGYLGGAVFYNILLYIPKNLFGHLIALGTILTIIAQFALQQQNLTPPANFLAVCATLFLLVWLFYSILSKPPAATPNLDTEENSRTASSRRLLLLCITVLILSLMHGINEGMLLSLYAEQSIQIYDLPRLFSIPGILAAGLIADYRQRRYLPLAVLLTMTMKIFCLLLLEKTATYTFSISLSYFSSGFFIMFISIIFLDAAPRTRHPSLWASMGRIIEMPAASLGAICGSLIWTIFSLSSILGIYTAILMLLMLLFHREIFPDAGVSPLSSLPVSPKTAPPYPLAEPETAQNPYSLQTEPNPYPASTPLETETPLESVPLQAETASPAEESLPPPPDFQQLYNLTKRETEILAKILAGLSIKDISASCSISERTVKYHITNLLHKTDTKSQKALILHLASLSSKQASTAKETHS